MDDLVASRIDTSKITESIFLKHSVIQDALKGRGGRRGLTGYGSSSETISGSNSAGAGAGGFNGRKFNASFESNGTLADNESSGDSTYEQSIQRDERSGSYFGSGATSTAASLIRAIPIVGRILPKIDPKEEKIKSLLIQQKSATNYQQWYDVCLELDTLLNNVAWKVDPKSDLYDYDLVKQSLENLREARLKKDYKLLLYLVRTTWIRNVGNMGNVNLYRHSYVGTKTLIEEYIQECELSLDYLVGDESVELDDKYLLGMLIQTRKNIGRTALVLSGGSTFGIFHIGVLATLLERNLLPRIVSGSSAGSIMASILCACTHEETVALMSTITERKFMIFGLDDEVENGGAEAAAAAADPKTSSATAGIRKSLKQLAHFLKYGTLFDISGLKSTMIGFVGETLTFREAYNRTGKILNITVSPASIHEQTRLLNHLTAPNCLIWSAVCASCSLPGVFPSTSIYEKNPRTGEIQEWNNDTSVKYVDGSVDNDLPITRLSEMFNVDHIIACQVNPHVVPFLKMSVTCVGGEVENEVSSRLKNFLSNVYDFMSSEVIHYLEILHEVGIGSNLSTKFISILSQQYSGDITILPDFNVKDFTKIFENPTPEFLLECIVRGARASWPKITVIKNHCGVEFALDKAITNLRGRVITKSTKNKFPAKSGNINGNGQPSNNNNTPFQPNVENANYNLVSSPILNLDSDSPSPVPEAKNNSQRSERPMNSIDGQISGASSLRKSTPRFKRHNTINFATYHEMIGDKEPSKAAARPKRKSIGSYTAFNLHDHDADNNESSDKNASPVNKSGYESPNQKSDLINPCFPKISKARGNSTTSLSGLYKNTKNERLNSLKHRDSFKKEAESERTPSPSPLHGRSKSFYAPEIQPSYDFRGESVASSNIDKILNTIDQGTRQEFPLSHQDKYEMLGLGINEERSSRTAGGETEGQQTSGDENFNQAKRIRKARSSGNFNFLEHGFGNNNNDFDNTASSRQLRYDAERIPYYKGNPYLDSPVATAVNIPSSPSQYTPSPSTTIPSSVTSQTNSAVKGANLPSKRVSTSNSLRNSYIGLNRLKDRSANGSYNNLKELDVSGQGMDGESYQKHLMNLTSPDIRRSYRGNTRIGLSRQNSEGVSLLIKKLTREQKEREVKGSSEDYDTSGEEKERESDETTRDERTEDDEETEDAEGETEDASSEVVDFDGKNGDNTVKDGKPFVIGNANAEAGNEDSGKENVEEETTRKSLDGKSPKRRSHEGAIEGIAGFYA